MKKSVTKKRVMVRVIAPALPDPDTGLMPKRIVRKKRKTARSPAKAETRRKVALAKTHPITPTLGRKRVTVSAATPKRVTVARRRLPDLWDIPWGERTEAQRQVNVQSMQFLRDTEERRGGRTSTIRQAYARLFGVTPPATVDLELVRQAVAYELAVRSYVAAGCRVPDKVRMNHEAALKFDVSLFEYGMRSLLESKFNAAARDEEQDMAKGTGILKSVKGSKGEGAPKFKGYVGTTSGLTIALFLIQLFEGNTKKRQSDETLAKVLHKEFPESGRWSNPCNVKEVKSMRSLFNNGRLAPQGGVAPRTRLTEFDSKGQVVEGRAPRTPKTATPKGVVRKTALKGSAPAPVKKSVKGQVVAPPAMLKKARRVA